MGDQKEVKPGVKVTSEAVFIGDFKFNYQSNLIKKLGMERCLSW